jgi:DNA-directed RNA polymerase subunit omega
MIVCYGGYNVARITVEDCLTKVPNRFVLVNMVAKRVRQIREGSEYLVSSPKNEDVVVSLREVAAGKVFLKPQNEPEEEPSDLENALEEDPITEDEPETEKDELTSKL